MSGDDSKAKEAAAAAHAIAENLNARVIVYSGYIDYAGVGQLLQTIGDGEERENTFFVLTTVGGDARAAYRIARFLQIVSKKFYLCVPSPENSWRVPIPVQTQEPPCGTSAVLTTTCATTEALA